MKELVLKLKQLFRVTINFFNSVKRAKKKILLRQINKWLIRCTALNNSINITARKLVGLENL